MALIDDTVEFNPWFWQQVHDTVEMGGYVLIEPDAVLLVSPLSSEGNWCCIYAAGNMGKICDWVDSLPGCERVYWARQIRDRKSRLRCYERATFTARARRLLHV